MAKEVPGTAEEQPADDLKSLLSDAFEESEKATPEVTERPAKTATESGGERKRAPDGKFAKTDGGEAEGEEAAAEGAEAEVKTGAEKTEGEVEEKPATGALEPPANWSEKDKATFRAIQDPVAKQFTLDRHKAMEADYTRKTQAIAQFRADYGPVEEMLAPYRDQIKAAGFTPASLVRNWHNVEVALMEGNGVDVVARVVDSYKIDKAKLAAKLGLTGAPADGAVPANGAQPANAAAVTSSPEIVELKTELAGLRGKITAREQAEREAQINAAQENLARVTNDIETFKGATNDKGELLNPHYPEVEATMIRLAKSYRANGQEPPALKDLYEEAVWATPSTRDKALTARQQSEERRKADEARAKAAKAKNAGSSVTGAPASGQSPRNRTVERSLREELEAAADDAA